MCLKSVVQVSARVVLLFRFALPAVLALVAVASASANTITATTDAYGDITTFATGTSIDIMASQFDLTAINAAITFGCAAGDFCGPATLVGIDEMFTANLTGTVTVANISGATRFIASR